MATGKEFIDYILDQLSPEDGITCRKMMGEYILYFGGKGDGAGGGDRRQGAAGAAVCRNLSGAAGTKEKSC